MAKVTSAQLQKQFGTYSEIAQREPVTITNHGRDSLVLLSAAAYARLKSFGHALVGHYRTIEAQTLTAFQRQLAEIEKAVKP